MLYFFYFFIINYMVIVYNDYELILNILTIHVAQKLQDHIIAYDHI